MGKCVLLHQNFGYNYTKMCDQNNPNQNKLIEKLKALGFDETTDEKFVKKSKSNSDITLEAFINGSGIIFHLNYKEKCIVVTIQTVDDKDIDEAFKEIWTILQLFAEEMSKTS